MVDSSEITLDEENSRHAVLVLRMKAGQQLLLTDGKGNLFTGVIKSEHKKRCIVSIVSVESQPVKSKKITIAISLLKSASRFEWFLEKATELGVAEIRPLICQRTEKQKFRIERMKQIIVSAMLQSQQTWMPSLHEPVSFRDYIDHIPGSESLVRLIAHCGPGPRQSISRHSSPGGDTVILVGPEGDFTFSEIETALKHDFKPVSLGSTRLRAETAGVAAAAFLAIE